jgi:hypothetical protein
MQSGSGGSAAGSAVQGGTNFVGSFTEAMASKKASDAMKKSMKMAMYLWQQEKKRQIEAYKPWTESGSEAATSLWEKIQAGPGEYQRSPYYNFLREEGVNALERGAAARGQQLGGREQKALTKYGQQLASTDYDTWLNNWYKSLVPYESVSNKGLAAEAALSGGQMNITNALSELTQNMGSVNAAQWLNLGNIMASNMRSTGNQIASGLSGGMGGMGGGISNMLSGFGGGEGSNPPVNAGNYGVNNALYGFF